MQELRAPSSKFRRDTTKLCTSLKYLSVNTNKVSLLVEPCCYNLERLFLCFYVHFMSVNIIPQTFKRGTSTLTFLFPTLLH